MFRFAPIPRPPRLASSTLPPNVAYALAAAALFALSGGCTNNVPLPRAALDLNAAGAAALAQGDLALAEARLGVALEYSSGFVEAWINMGYVELKRGHRKQAKRDFLRARHLNPDLPAPLHALAVCAEEDGQPREAEEQYLAALKVDPGFGPARANLGRLLFARRDCEGAREQFERLVQVAPDAVEGWAGHAEALLCLGREADAEQVLRDARARLGRQPALEMLLARQRLALGAWDEAIAVLAPLVQDPDPTRSSAAWAWIAVGRAGKRDAAGARQAAQAALALNRNEAVARYALRVSEAGETPWPRARR